MDSITRTAQAAVIQYYNALRRIGAIRRQDKYNLLVLWFFHYLKNESDFLYRWDNTKKTFTIDTYLEQQLEKKFRCSIECLADASCFIKLLPSDNCTPVIGNNWYANVPEDEADKLLLFIPNATGIPLDNGEMDLTTSSIQIEDIGEFLQDTFTDEDNGILDSHDDMLIGEKPNA